MAEEERVREDLEEKIEEAKPAKVAEKLESIRSSLKKFVRTVKILARLLLYIIIFVLVIVILFILTDKYYDFRDARKRQVSYYDDIIRPGIPEKRELNLKTYRLGLVTTTLADGKWGVMFDVYVAYVPKKFIEARIEAESKAVIAEIRTAISNFSYSDINTAVKREKLLKPLILNLINKQLNSTVKEVYLVNFVLIKRKRT